ncbi:MAG: hypothetical protein IJ080_07345 [Oscillospiraceae bacterium]|nr:hypothetical protein [Oscillospiraceae bacterium]
MNFKKITAAVAAAALTASMCAVSAAAETVTLGTAEEYPGDWSNMGFGITKEQLKAVGGDVKITMHVEIYDKFGLADQYLINPVDYDNGWISQSSEEFNYLHPGTFTADDLTVKSDGWICVNKDDTELTFVYAADAIDALGDTGLCFSLKSCMVTSVDFEKADAKMADIAYTTDALGKEYCFADKEAAPTEEAPAEEAVEEAPAEEAAPAVEEAPAEEAPAVVEAAPAVVEATANTPTGNTSTVAVLAVMAAAAVVGAVSRKK